MKNTGNRVQPTEIKLSIKSPDTPTQSEVKRVVPVKISVVPDRARKELSTKQNSSSIPQLGVNRGTTKGVVKGFNSFINFGINFGDKNNIKFGLNNC